MIMMFPSAILHNQLTNNNMNSSSNTNTNTNSNSNNSNSNCSDSIDKDANIMVNLFADGTESRVSTDFDPYVNPKDIVKRSNKNSVHITFKFQAIDHSLSWESVLYAGILYVTLEEDYSPAEYSKESFIALLESAEEQFQCKNVVVCLVNKSLIRPFVFLGFELLPPNHPLVPYGASKNMIFMSYQLDYDSM